MAVIGNDLKTVVRWVCKVRGIMSQSTILPKHHQIFLDKYAIRLRICPTDSFRSVFLQQKSGIWNLTLLRQIAQIPH
jgi:hypothetical protein